MRTVTLARDTTIGTQSLAAGVSIVVADDVAFDLEARCALVPDGLPPVVMGDGEDLPPAAGEKKSRKKVD